MHNLRAVTASWATCALPSIVWRLVPEVLLTFSQGGTLMIKLSKYALILGLAGALAGLPTLVAAQKDPDAAGVAEDF